MREIKFRAWNGEQMISPDYVDRDGVAWWRENSIPNSSDKISQFTGLRDKNGKEIYENDILQHTKTNGEKVIKGYVEYLRGGYKLIRKELQTEWPLLGYVKNCKVIGNIYENPELLTEIIKK